jgi:hypothetical protein
MTAEIEGDKELKVERVIWIGRGQITQETGCRASERGIIIVEGV